MPRIIILPVVLLLGWLGGGTWFWVCQVRGLCGDEPVEVRSEADASSPALNPFATKVAYQGADLMVLDDTLKFPRSESQPVLSAAYRLGFGKLVNHLKAHPNQDIEILASYSEAEENDTQMPNLGLGRAQAIGQLLIDEGIDASRFIKLPTEISDSLFRDDTLLGGVAFRLIDRVRASEDEGEEGAEATMAEGEGEDDGTEETESVMVNKPEKGFFFFKYNKFQIILGEEERAFITQTLTYLRQHPDARLLLTGHADNSGLAANNMALSQQRAETVKGYFESFGLDISRVDLAHEGASNPIASNDTEEGRARNRRVEAVIR